MRFPYIELAVSFHKPYKASDINFRWLQAPICSISGPLLKHWKSDYLLLNITIY